MNVERVLRGCTVYPDSSSICGMPHSLVKSPGGDLFWVDDFFLQLIEAYHSRHREKSVSKNFSLPKEMIARAFEEVGALFFSENQRKYHLPGVSGYRHPTYNPLISIIIVNWNGEAHLKEIMDSIRAQSYDRYEIIVVDNGSTDRSVELLRSSGDVMLLPQERNIGFCKGNNLGIKAAKGEIVFLLNNDTVLDNRCLENAIRCFAESPEDTIGVFPKMLFYDTPQIINCTKTQWHCVHMWRDNSVGLLDFPERQRREQVFGGIFAGVFLYRKKFERIGLFDESFFSYGEDFDVCYRANLAGYRFFSEPASIVYHRYRTSSHEETNIYFTLYYFLRNYVCVILKNYELRKIGAALAYFRREFWSPWASRAKMNREAKLKRVLRKIILSLLMRAPHMLYERMRMRHIRAVPDRDLWVFENLDRYNIFHYEGKPVLNLLNVRTSFYGNAEYTVNGKKYVVFGKSRHVPIVDREPAHA